MAQIIMAYEGQVEFANDLLAAVFGKPKGKGGELVPMTSAKTNNPMGVYALMRSLSAKAAAVHGKKDD